LNRSLHRGSMSFTESYSGLVPKRPFYEELVRDGGLVRSYIQTSTSLDPSTSSTPSTTSSIPSTTSSTPSTSQIGQAGMVIPSAISTPVFMHGLRRARTKRAQERREALSREAAAGVAAAGKARGINNNKIDTMDTIREQLARDYPEPIWPTGRDTKWQFQVSWQATDGQPDVTLNDIILGEQSDRSTKAGQKDLRTRTEFQAKQADSQ
jgi:hypothetical protein